MINRTKLCFAALGVVVLTAAGGPSGADPFRGAVGAGLLGAGIGGIAGGSSGAAKGAAIGAGLGLLGGARQQEQRQQQQQQQQLEQQRLQQQQQEAARMRAEQERLALERQRLEMEQQLHRERMAMQQQQQQQFAAPNPAQPGFAPQPAFDPALVADIQRSLIILGYQPGPIDGQLGPSTVAAIQAYESNNALLVTGQPSQPLLQHMRARGG